MDRKEQNDVFFLDYIEIENRARVARALAIRDWIKSWRRR